MEVFESGCHEGDECEVKVVEYCVVYTHSLRWLVEDWNFGIKTTSRKTILSNAIIYYNQE